MPTINQLVNKKRKNKVRKSNLRVNRMPVNERAYRSSWGYRQNVPVADDFTLDEILDIIRSGDFESLRELSRYYYRTNSNYRNNIDFLAHLPLYDNLVIPIYEEGKGSQA